MKLAEALQERADLNRQIKQMKERLRNNAVVQEGETPAEDPAGLTAQLDCFLARLEQLITAINLANCAVRSEGKSLTELIAQKDCLALKISMYRDFLSEASYLAHRASRTEIKIHSSVDVPALQKQVDAMSKQMRLLDNRIQQINWTTEVQVEGQPVSQA